MFWAKVVCFLHFLLVMLMVGSCTALLVTPSYWWLAAIMSIVVPLGNLERRNGKVRFGRCCMTRWENQLRGNKNYAGTCIVHYCTEAGMIMPAWAPMTWCGFCIAVGIAQWLL